MSPVTVAQSMLDPAGPQAAAIESLWWFILWICTGVFVIVMALVAVATLRPKNRITPDATLTRWVVAGTGATLAILFVWLAGSVWIERAIASPKMEGAVTLNVTGRRFWWQIEYVDTRPANRFRTANEIVIPVGRPVVVNVTSRDVIHSFWVPNLHGKRDLIPGYVTSIWFQADRAGTYRGQCAEFCGHQHANMGLFVKAQTADEFERWIAAQRQDAPLPVTDSERQGHDVFMRATCPQCHAIRGTLAGGAFGPDLTHVGSRASIGAGILPNTPDNLKQWIRDSQAIKPGNKMPAHDLSDDDLAAVADYLESLK